MISAGASYTPIAKHRLGFSTAPGGLSTAQSPAALTQPRLVADNKLVCCKKTQHIFLVSPEGSQQREPGNKTINFRFPHPHLREDGRFKATNSISTAFGMEVDSHLMSLI